LNGLIWSIDHHYTESSPSLPEGLGLGTKVVPNAAKILRPKSVVQNNARSIGHQNVVPIYVFSNAVRASRSLLVKVEAAKDI
jgi:hypothetical protein